LITEKQIKLSKKASKVIYGNWEGVGSTEDQYKLRRSNGSVVIIDKSVEIVIVFKPRNDRNAEDILRFLYDCTHSEGQDSVPGSWDIPDIRATSSLISKVSPGMIDLYPKIKSNILSQDTSRLIILKKTSELRGDGRNWKSVDTLQNNTLVKFLTGFDVES